MVYSFLRKPDNSPTYNSNWTCMLDISHPSYMRIILYGFSNTLFQSKAA